ncbi:hypothetical protein ABL78_2162 [Leptomonas seymouri]|uniref:Uncharacterized protein n=1 Tax=Leptomonas seymouri TaxID=5684 RepID=C6K3W7_LEPSE|nr:conserved hypothetical protein [Leptomonas seymouri]KPI88702.1 hypothetical protein ABL78_2162 [Leptomonas seymouri]|eukprot:KPI88702.1 hypothetical protein ABL78_2162 [Leptomonas seymouri]
MSGLWSFREPSFVAGTNGAPQHARLPTHVVTEILPVGVEYKRSLLPDTSQVAAACASECDVTVAALHDLACISSRGSENEEGPEGQADPLGPSCVCTAHMDGSAGASFTGLGNDKLSADLVDRDEAVSEVQRRWWRTFNVDVRPAVDLPSSAHISEVASANGANDVDEEALQTAHLLLARIASSDSSHAAGPSTTRATRIDESRMKRMSPKGTRKAGAAHSQGNEAQRGVSHEKRAGTSESWTGASPTAVSLEPRSLIRCGVQQQELLANVRTASAYQQTKESTRSTSLFQSTNTPSEGQCDESRCSSLPREGERSKATETFSDVSLAVSSVGLRADLGMPSEALQRALRSAPTTATPRTEDCNVDADGQRCTEKVARVMLRHYYALWLTAAEGRRIQRCAASYHDYLLQCVRDALSEGSFT